jgi:uncharacterized protein
MEFEQTFTVPVSADEAWEVLQDVERIAPCMPGASLEEASGDDFRGVVKVKLGPMTVTYRGTARFVERDKSARRVVIEASGKEARGAGTARATITSSMVDQGDRTQVKVHTDLAITGRPAQFGRGVMTDVAGKLLDQFAERLSAQLDPQKAPAAAPRAELAEPERPAAEAEPLDLMAVARGPVLKRAAPLAVAIAAVALVAWLIRRRR